MKLDKDVGEQPILTPIEIIESNEVFPIIQGKPQLLQILIIG